ncbi:MAG TPA: magnesium transporter CorA family protein [Alphaproteobacteria bacterium]
MIVAYVQRDSSVERVEVGTRQPLPAGALWFDLFEPTPEEKIRVETALGIALPTRDEMREIEPSSRLYVENDASYMTATVLARADEPNPASEPICFILTRRALVTLRYVDPRPIATFASRLCRPRAPAGSGEDVLVGLVEAFVDRIADVLEKVGVDLDAVSHRIFDASRRAGESDLQAVLKTLGRNDDLVSTARESLLSLSRVVRFFGQAIEADGRKGQKELKNRLKIVMRDVASLNEHAAFESQKVNFLLDATLGMINIEQNRIIKLFSVAAVVFLPPTLVASIYGMNFRHMPELDWTFGYPLALGLMVLSAVLPYLYFKRKGWF